MVTKAGTERELRFTRSRVPPAAAVTVLAAAAAVVSLVPAAQFHLMSPAAGAMVLAARGMTELLASYLAGQRFFRTASPLDYGITVGLGVMAVGHIGFV